MGSHEFIPIGGLWHFDFGDELHWNWSFLVRGEIREHSVLILGNGQCFHKNVHVGSDLLRHLTSSVIDCIEIVTSDLSLD